MAYLRAKDTVNGALGTCYARIDGERHELMQVKNVTATVKKTRTEIPILGLTGKQHKSGGWEGTGKMISVLRFQSVPQSDAGLYERTAWTLTLSDADQMRPYGGNGKTDSAAQRCEH